MAESYVENFNSKIDFPKPFQRTGKFPLDRSELFSSYADAVKYAAGNRQDPDSRGLCGTSYVGQTITVYENDVVTDYKILPNRTLQKIPTIMTVLKSLEIGETEIDVELPNYATLLSVDVYDKSTGEQILTDVSNKDKSINVSIAEAYTSPLDIVVSYYS